MNIRPSTHCCGCGSLLFGVEMISLWYLIGCVATVAIASSVDSLLVSGVAVPPMVQVLAAAWSLIGIPITLGAGVGALYRVEAHLRIFFLYMAVNFAIGAFASLYILFSGAICNSTVAPDVQRMGAAFVCGFTDTFAFMWELVFGIVNLYFMYIVWSAAEELAKTPYPELMRYTETLRSVKQVGPPSKGELPIGREPGIAASKAEAAIAGARFQQESLRQQSKFKPDVRSSGGTFSGSYGGYGGVTYASPDYNSFGVRPYSSEPSPRTDAFSAYQAQSFVPAPQSLVGNQGMAPRYLKPEDSATRPWSSAPVGVPSTVNTLEPPARLVPASTTVRDADARPRSSSTQMFAPPSQPIPVQSMYARPSVEVPRTSIGPTQNAPVMAQWSGASMGAPYDGSENRPETIVPSSIGHKARARASVGLGLGPAPAQLDEAGRMAE